MEGLAALLVVLLLLMTRLGWFSRLAVVEPSEPLPATLPSQPVVESSDARTDIDDAVVVTPADAPLGIPGEGRGAIVLRDRVAALASLDVPVLFVGPPGSGKLRMARALHAQSARAGGPLLEFDSGRLRDVIAQVALFGARPGCHCMGATGPGALERARGGTLILRDVDQLDLDTQAKLLRVLLEQRYCQIGDQREQAADVRIVATTTVCLAPWTATRRFREDVYEVFEPNIVATSGTRVDADAALASFLPLVLQYLVRGSAAHRGYLELYGDDDAPGEPGWWACEGFASGEIGSLQAWISRGDVAKMLASGRTAASRGSLTVRIGDDPPLGAVYLERAGEFPPTLRRLVEDMSRSHIVRSATRLLADVRSESDDRPTVASRARVACRTTAERLDVASGTLSREAMRTATMGAWQDGGRGLERVVELATLRAAQDGVDEVQVRHLFPDDPPTEPTLQQVPFTHRHRVLSRVLDETGWDLHETARRLDLRRAQLYALIRDFRLTG